MDTNITGFHDTDRGTEYWLYIAMVIEDLQKELPTLKKLSCRKKLILYCFDTWERDYREWDDILDEINPYAIFFAYKRTVEYFSDKRKRAFFLPQSMDTDHFFPHNIKKTRLFMQMGRRNESIHGFIKQYLLSHEIQDTDENYVYEREKGKIIYQKTDDLSENISRSYFFACAPQDYENKELTGRISEVTARYYEAMACKSLVIGFKPETFDEIFPSEAMVEIRPDGRDFDAVIDYYLSHEKEYYEKINNNYEFVKEHCTWKNRLTSLLNDLSMCGKDVFSE